MAQEYEIDIMRFNGQDYDTLLPTPAAHATTHQADGSDPITMQTGNYGDNTITSEKIVDGAVSKNFTATIPTSGWTMDDGWGTIQISVSGLLASDSPIVDINMEAISGTENLLYGAEYWGNVFRAVTYANAIRIYAYEAPTMDIPIKMVVIRK